MRALLNLALAGLLVVACMSLIRSSYEARRLTDLVERASAESIRLTRERERLETERQGLGRHARIESVARERLGMTMPATVVTVEDPKDRR